MIFYRITIFKGDEHPTWVATMPDAHAHLKKVGAFQPDARIELFDLPTDKLGILRTLNGEDAEGMGLSAQRTWKLTARGGLSEVENGE